MIHLILDLPDNDNININTFIKNITLEFGNVLMDKNLLIYHFC